MITILPFMLFFLVVYPSVSRLNSGGMYGKQENNLADVWIWDDGVPIIWDDEFYITIYG